MPSSTLFRKRTRVLDLSVPIQRLKKLRTLEELECMREELKKLSVLARYSKLRRVDTDMWKNTVFLQ